MLRTPMILPSIAATFNISDPASELDPSNHRVHTEWQLPLSGVHSLDQPGEGGWCTATPFHYIYHHIQSWEGRYTPPISTLPQCVLCASNKSPPPPSFQDSWALDLITSPIHHHPKRKRPFCALCSFYIFKLTIFLRMQDILSLLGSRSLQPHHTYCSYFKVSYQQTLDWIAKCRQL